MGSAPTSDSSARGPCRPWRHWAPDHSAASGPLRVGGTGEDPRLACSVTRPDITAISHRQVERPPLGEHPLDARGLLRPAEGETRLCSKWPLRSSLVL